MSDRSQRMIDSAPDYYVYAKAFTEIQEAIAADLDTVDTHNDDLQLQLYIPTATWGLKYWEKTLSIPTIEADSYDIRRSRVLSKWRGVGNFSAKLVKSVAESYANGTVDVTVDIPNHEITITFVGKYGIPPNIDDLKAAIDNIIHAHMGADYVYTYLTWDVLDGYNKTWDDIDAQALTWDQFEVWKP